MHHSNLEAAPLFTGKSVIDEHGEPLGSVSDVIFDPQDESPEYLVVKPGVFQRSHYVPVDGSYESVDGDIVVTWERQWIKRSPAASRDHVLSNRRPSRHRKRTTRTTEPDDAIDPVVARLGLPPARRAIPS